MLISIEQINTWMGTLLWPLFRVAGLLSIMPTLGGGEVPARVRIGLAVAITWLILPSIGAVPALDPLSVDSILISAQQVLIGVAMGLIVLLVFNAVTLAGESIAITMGLGFALMNDPQNGVQVPTVSQFYLILATLLFLSFNGHHAVLILLSTSFTMLPIGGSLDADALWHLVSWGSVVFRGGLAIALPAITAMLSVNIVMGVITRAAPQLNLFSIGFPITMTVGFLMIMVTLPVFGQEFQSLMAEAQVALSNLLSH
ncbi:MAG: flagellar biosynthetic protein FliR [Granulosicoccus sp.]